MIIKGVKFKKWSLEWTESEIPYKSLIAITHNHIACITSNKLDTIKTNAIQLSNLSGKG